MTPRVSVVMPSFNQARFLPEAIDSVLGQDGAAECLVIDGGSTDGSREILERYGDRLAFWCSEPDRGQSHAFNKGLARASGDIIGWLNSDDLYLPGAVAAGVRYLDAHPSIDVVFADYWFVDEHGRWLRRRREPRFDPRVYLWTRDCYHANCAAFFRRSLFDRVGGLDEALHHGMDYDLYLRASRGGCAFGQVQEDWGAYRLHPDSKSLSAPGVRLSDSRTVAERFEPAGIGSVGRGARRAAWSAARILRKAALGSYLVRSRRPPTLAARPRSE